MASNNQRRLMYHWTKPNQTIKQNAGRKSKKGLDVNYTSMLHTVQYKFWKWYSKRLLGHLPPISQTIQVRRAKHTGQMWIPAHGYIRVGRPEKLLIISFIRALDTVKKTCKSHSRKGGMVKESIESVLLAWI